MSAVVVMENPEFPLTGFWETPPAVVVVVDVVVE